MGGPGLKSEDTILKETMNKLRFVAIAVIALFAIIVVLHNDCCLKSGVKTMNNSKDDHITRTVINKLASRGFGQSQLTVQTSKGLVTVSGRLQYAHQQSAARKAIAGMTGIRRVANQVTVKPTARRT